MKDAKKFPVYKKSVPCLLTNYTLISPLITSDKLLEKNYL